MRVLTKHFKEIGMQKIIFILIAVVLLNSNLFADFVATITAVKGEATIARNATKLVAKTGLKLQEKDSVITQKNAKVQIIFKDETIITIGQKSHFSIKEYLFDANEEPSAKFGMFGGAMRAITGKIGKVAPQKFNVTTKTATIGIRGTNFTVAINENGALEAYCTYGEISVKIKGIEHSIKQGYFARIGTANHVDIKPFTPSMLKSMRERKFGTVKNKNAQVSKGQNVVIHESNDKQLNLTVDDKTDVTISDVTEEKKDTLFTARTLDATIAGYSMENAIYYGNYTMIENHSSYPDNGDVKLSIQFAKDTALLELGSFKEETPNLQYQFENVNKSQVVGSLISGAKSGEATIEFYGPTGNIVNGSFDYIQKQKNSNGVYSAKNFEALH